MGKEEKSLVVLGGSKDEGMLEVKEAAAAAGVRAQFFESDVDFRHFVDHHDPLAVLLRSDRGAESTCVQLRTTPRFSNTPIFGVTSTRNDLSFVELFSWGGDDLVEMSSSRSLARRLRGVLANQHPSAPPDSSRCETVVVAGEDRKWRTVMARTLLNGGYNVRFVSNEEQALTELTHQRVKLIVAADELAPSGASRALKRAREAGSDVPWVIVAPPKRLMSATTEVIDVSRVAVTDAYAPPENALFIANELVRPNIVDKRSSDRLLYGTAVAFRTAGRDDDEIGFSYNLSAGGIYIRTLAPLDAGEEAWIELWPPRSERRVRLAGKVAWKRGYGRNESATVPPGFGLQITDGLAGDLERYRLGYEAFAEMLGGGKRASRIVAS